MKKIFKTILGLTLGFAMAAGVGVGVATKKANPVYATTYSNVYVLDTTGTLQTDNNVYGSTGTATTGGVTWTFTGNGKINPWRLGGKTAQSGNQPFYTGTAISGGVDRIVVEFGAISGLTASSFQMSVHNSSSDASSGNNAVETHTGLDIGANTTATIDLNATQTGKFYRFVPNLTISASSNKYLQLNKVTFKVAEEEKTLSSIVLGGTYQTSFTQGDTFNHDGMTVTAKYSDADDADVTDKATWSSPDMSTAGNGKTVTVSYTENGTTKTADYTIDVAAATVYSVGGTIANGSLSSTDSVREGNALNINIVPSAKYKLPTTLSSVTMGGNTLVANTDYTYNSTSGAFSIPSVTGNVVINATCDKKQGYWADVPYTIAEAIAAIDASSDTQGVYTRGIVCGYYNSGFSDTPKLYTGKTSFYFTDDGSEGHDGNGATRLEAYNCYKASGSTVFDNISEVPEIGDTVVVYGNLIKYNSTYEYAQNCYLESVTPPSYTVTYNDNGATSGSVPVDSNSYTRHSNVTLATNSGSLAKTGYVFNGWNTMADPTAVGMQHFNAGATYENIESNLTLYAEWLLTSPSITVQANLTGFTGEEIDVGFTYGYIDDPTKISVVAADDIVTVGDLIAENNEGCVTIIFNEAGDTSLSFQNNGVELATCDVTVNQSTVTITGLPSTAEVYIDKTLDLGSKITVTPTGSYGTSVTWVSGDTDVATVNANGVVTGKAEGDTTITVTSVSDPNVSQTCTVYVGISPLDFTWDLSVDDTSSASEERLEWNDRRANMIADKANATVNANNYYPSTPNQSYTSTRFYKNSTLTIEPVAGYIIRFVVFTATTQNYANVLTNSAWTNASASVDNVTVTVTPTDGTDDIVATIGNTCGFISVKVYYTDPITYIDSLDSIATIHGNETEPGVVSSVALRFGTEISKNAWKAIDEEYGIDYYGVMLFRTTEERLSSVLSVKEYFELGEENVTISRREGSNAPSSEGDYYDFSVQINISTVSKFNRYYCAAPFFVVDGQYHFLEEMRFSVNLLAQYYLTHPGSDLSTEALTYLATAN